ncbi:hypothetical protein AVEN_67312-1 [Araneus ventricosus]|uniref:Uncharacterized protein n=1 Tax=Araneus ventricosus TaxID=182803 RepID=A0A4Y2LWD5_ARAVE|nr:hypothetical protein AVEN_67312-1 [Araneus ventricosus]
MNFLPILLFSAGVVACVYSNAIPAGYDAENLCPPPENIAPCTCYKSPFTYRVTARCSNFTNSYEIKAIFDRNPDWKLQEVWIDGSVMPFLPAKMLEEAHFQFLNVSSTSLVTLFDKTPVTTPELSLYMYDVKILRGFQWSDIANSTLLEMRTRNMTIRSLGKDFKDNIPKGVQRLYFENTGITSIKNQAFSHLQKLKVLEIRRGSLKKLSRDWFPRPWNVTYLDFSYQKIAALPEDILADLPMLSVFFFEGNLLSTISEKVFSDVMVFYILKGNPINCNCNIKWIIGKFLPLFLQGECAEPESLKGTELKYLTKDNFRHCN